MSSSLMGDHARGVPGPGVMLSVFPLMSREGDGVLGAQ